MEVIMSRRLIRSVAIAASILGVWAGGTLAQTSRGSGSAQPKPPLKTQPRFKVEAVGVKALDESGPDWLGSDKIYAITQAAGSTMRTETLEGVDTGETHLFATDLDCIVPLHGAYFVYPCAAGGVDGPLSFTVNLYKEGFDWGAVFGHFRPWSDQPGPYDDLIGRETVTFTEERLLGAMPNVGDTDTQWVRLGGPCGYVPPGGVCGSSPYSLTGTGPEYLFIYRITRLADHLVLSTPP
jgi:hypothetical protein